MTTQLTPENFGRLVAEVRALQEQGDRFEEKLDKVLDTVNATNQTLAEWRGGGRVAILAASVISFVVSIATAFALR